MSWQIDNSHSSIEFSAKHMLITTVRGRFERFGGTVDIDEQNPAISRVEFTVEADSLSTRDANRDGHLRSPDFLDVATYPTLTFVSRRVEPVGRDGYRLIGDLTIRDVAREVVFDVVDEGGARDPWGGTRRAFSARAKINRKDFGLTWNVGLETGGLLVGDDVRIEVEIQLVQTQSVAAELAGATA